MQQQASAWLSAATNWIYKKRPSINRLIIVTLIAPLIVSVTAPEIADAASVAAGDSTCTQTVNSSTAVSVTRVSNDCVVTFTAPNNTTTSNTWTVPALVTSIQVLVIGGGGSGGSRHAGGGGAGGYVSNSSFSVTPSNAISVTVGAGGAAVGSATSNGNNGANSVFGSITAYGGGFGGQSTSGGSGATVGSAGGSCCANAAGTTSSGQGNNGGKGTRGNSEANWSGGGGGGAAGLGGNSTSDQSIGGADGYTTAGNAVAGAGGLGQLNSITGSSVCYAAGGGGGSGGSGASVGLGGQCSNGVTVGGAGTTSYTPNATQGTDGTGSGGGGAGFVGGTNGVSGRGGSGVVIVRYTVPLFTVTFSANGGTGSPANSSISQVITNAYGPITLSAQGTLTRTGYTFAGWNTSANGTGTNYSAGSSYTPNASLTLYAQWNSTISYNTNGATTNQSILSTSAVGSGGTTTLSNGLGTGAPVSSGLVMNLDASDPTSISGTTWVNKSSSGLASATIVGSPKYDSTDGSFQLNGVDQYFNLGTTDYAYVGTTSFSIGVSFNSTDPNTTSCLLARYNGNVAGSYFMRLVSNGQLGVSREVSPYSVNSASNLIQAGNTYYASMTYDGTNLRGYLNGTLVVGPTAMGSVYASTIATLIGGCQYNSALWIPFKGKIYNAQIYNRALSASEVQTNFQNLLGGRRIGKTNYTLGPWTTAADTGTAYGNPMQFDISALPTPYFRLNADSYVSSSTPLVASVGASNLSITTTGTIVAKASGGGANGANARFATIGGTTSGGIRLGNAEVKNYTLCTLARYAPKSDGSTGSKGRLIANYSTTGNNNWFSGWYSGTTRQFHHGAWVLNPTDVDDDWHLSCDSGNTIYWDGVLQTTGVTPQAYTSLPQLAINWDYYAQNSDWEFAEMIVYDSVLSSTQMNQISRYFTNRYGLINVASAVASAAAPSTVTNFASPGNTTLYASWQSTITYDPNEATSGNVPASQSIWITPGTVAANTGSLTKTGYIFNGWNTAANGTGTSFAVGAPLINDGNKVLYAQWVLPVNFPIAKINPSSLAPYQRFIASDYDAANKIWKDSSGNGRNAGRIAGTPSVVTTSANTNGASKSFNVISGDTTAKIWFGNAPITPNWTVFALSRYSGASKARIVTGDSDRTNSNILIGHWSGGAGIAHLNGWVGSTSTPAGITATNWIMSTAFPYNYRLNGTSMATSGGTNVLSALGINTYTTEVSNFEVAEVIIFDRTLTSSEITQVEDYFDETYGLAYPKVGTYKATSSLTVANSFGGRSETFTATDGYGTKTFSITPNIPGITLDVSTTNNVAVVVAPTLSVGTYNETITATDSAGNTTLFPFQVTVVNPLIWSGSNPSAIVTTYGKPTRTRLDLSGGFGTRVAAISHLTSPAPRRVTIDTSTISSGYITLITDTGTAPGTYSESITVTDSSNVRRTLLLTITINAPPDISYSTATDAPYPYRTTNLVLNVEASNISSYSGSGQTLTDLSANAKSFTFKNASDVNTNGVFTDLAGGALSFDGANLYAQSTSLPSMDTYTVEAWVTLGATNTTDAWRSIVTDMWTTNGDKINYHLGTCGAASNEICGYFFDGSAWVAKASFIVALNTWYHVTYVVGGTTGNHVGYLYVNGVLVSTSVATSSNPTTSNRGIRIGRRWDAAQYWNGLIGSVRIYNTALSATQISQNYSNTKPRFLSLSAIAPTNSGNVSLTTTEGKATTFQVFAETGGTGASTFALSGTNSTFSLGSIAADQTSLIVGSNTTATNATTAKTYYETLTATDSASAATAYYLTINVNPKIAITATVDTVTTTYGKTAYDTITAAYGTGNLTFTRTSSSGSSAITSSVSGNQAILTISPTLPVGTYFETFTVSDSVSATSLKVIAIVINPVLSISVPDGTTLNTTITKAASRRVLVYYGTDTRTATFSLTSKDASSGITLDQTNLQAASGGYLTVNVGTSVPANTYTYLISVLDSTGSVASTSLTVVVNKWPTIQNVSAVSDNVRLLYDASIAGSATNSQWNDLSGSNKNMSITSGAIVTGESTGLISFNESTTTTSYGSIANLGSALDTFSVETWIRISGRPTTEACILCESGGGNKNIYFFIRSSGNIGGNYYNGNWASQTPEFSSALNTWYHVVFTVSKVGSNYYQDLYINGTKYGSTSAASNLAPVTANQAYVVSKAGNASDYMKISMPLLRLYGRSLTAAEVQQNYLANLSRFASASSGTTSIVTTAGASSTSQNFTASSGTGVKTFTRATNTSGISLASTSENTFSLNFDKTLTSVDSQTARTIYETVTATDSSSATSALAFAITVNPPIIETATALVISTTSGIETSTVIYASKGTGTLTLTRTGTSVSGISFTPGTNQATLRVLSTINPGTYYETVTATDSASATTSIMITIYVAPPPSITGQTRMESTKGVTAKSSLYAISGGTGTLTMSLTNSPANPRIILTGTSTSGGYLYVDSTSETGTYTSTIRVTDARGSFSQIVVTVVVNAPVTLSGNLSITKTYGTSTTNGYSTNGSGTAPFAFSATPVCASVKTVSGNLTTEQINGTDSCTWTAPVGVSTFDALIVGGGGGGGADGGSGGGGGSINTLTGVSVPASRQLGIQVGAGGSGGVWAGSASTSGGTSSIVSGATTYTAPGGSGGGGCGAAAAAGGVRGSGGSTVAGAAGGYGASGACNAGSGGAGSGGYSPNFLGNQDTYGGGGGGGPYPDSISSVGGSSGGTGGGGNGAISKGFGSYGLPTYFRSLGSTPNAASNQDAFTSGLCGSVTGNFNYTTDSDFPCSQKDNFQGYATGFFVSPYTGSITFCLYSDDSSYLNINGQTLNKTGASTSWLCTSAISGFTNGVAYPISAYFTEMTGAASWKIGYTYGTGGSTVGSTSSPVIIPISQFRSGSTGLAQYFNVVGSTPPLATTKPRLTSSSTGDCMERVGNINYNADADFPCSSKDNFQGYATGWFVSPYTGDITFSMLSDDSSDLEIEVNGITNELQRPCCGESSVTWSGFVQGQYYPIRVYFAEVGGIAQWTLSYAYGSQAKTIIPVDNFRSMNEFTQATAGTNGLGGGGGAGSAGLHKLPGARGGSGTVIVRYTTQSDTATETMITAYVNQVTPTGLLTLNVPSFVTVGTYFETITVQDAVNSAPYSATVRITINKATPTATIALPGGVTTAQYGTPVTLTVNATAPGNVAFKRAGSTITGCSSVATSNGVATCLWTPPAVETTTITALLSPTDSVNYNNSVETATSLTVTVGKADSLTVTANSPTAITYSANMTMPTNGFTTLGLRAIDTITAMTYTYSDSASVVLAGAPTNAGTYTITPSSPTFNPGAASNYQSIQYVSGTLVINKAPRGSWTASYAGGSNQTRYGVGKTETATVTYPGDGVRTFSTTSSVCSVDASSGTLTTLGVGTCTIQVVLSLTQNWLSDTKTVTVTIDRGLRTATITSALSIIKYGDTTTVTSTISPALDSATVTYSANGTLGCLVDNVTGLVTGIKALTACSVRVTYDRTDLYESATATTSITVNRASAPVITTESITAVSYTGTTAIVTPTYRVTGILARDISQILPTADVSSVAAIAAITASSYSQVSSFRYFATTPTNYDSTTAPTFGGTYAVTAQGLTLRGGLDIANYETPTTVSSNLVINPIAQAPLVIKLSYLESVTVPYDVVTTGGSSTGARTLTVLAGGTATGCAVDLATSAMRLKSSSAGTCIIRVTQAADRNYLVATSDSQTVNILNFVVNILQLFNNPTGISINSYVPYTKGPDVCTSNCRPTITRISDMNGTTITSLAANTPFRIIGTNFNTTTSVQFSAMIGTEDIFGEDADSFQIDSDTQLTVMPPAILVPAPGQSNTATTVLIHVRASGGLSSPNMSITSVTL